MKKEDKTLTINVYEIIKGKILNLEFRPGKSLSVATIADSLGMSRSPVHDAIMKLASENLVDVFPKSGSRVSLIDIKRTEDERFIRKSLELNAIHDMFYSFDETYLSTMEECIAEHEKAFKEKRYIDTLYWDGQFHSQIFKCIHREYCWEICNQYSANEYRVRLLAEKAIATTKESVLQNHRDIVRFLHNRDLEAVLKVEEQHLARISSEITILVASFPSIFTTTNNIAATPLNIRAKEDYNENFFDSVKVGMLKLQ